MGKTYQRTIEVAAPVTRAWEAFVDDREREAWLGAGRPDDVFERVDLKIGPVERNHLVSWSQRQDGLDGWYETSARFEEVDGGTRIIVVRSGFGETEDWLHYAASMRRARSSAPSTCAGARSCAVARRCRSGTSEPASTWGIRVDIPSQSSPAQRIA